MCTTTDQMVRTLSLFSGVNVHTLKLQSTEFSKNQGIAIEYKTDFRIAETRKRSF